MTAQILSAAPGRVTKFHGTDTGFVIESITDVTKDVEYAQALHNEGHHRSAGGAEHLARVPIAVLSAWALKRGTTFDAVMRDNRLLSEFLNDPDHSAFRISKSRA